jgi:hypothetical protein
MGVLSRLFILAESASTASAGSDRVRGHDMCESAGAGGNMASG